MHGQLFVGRVQKCFDIPSVKGFNTAVNAAAEIAHVIARRDPFTKLSAIN
jgi:hypothetical protein